MWSTGSHHALRDRVRDASDRVHLASAGCVDAQSVKGADTVGAAVRGFDAGKKVNGRKRHVVVDTMGLLLLVVITSASGQDRDGARKLLDRLKMEMPSLSLLRADGGYAGKLLDSATGFPTSPSRSCVNPWESRCSRRFHGGGWSSAHSPGS